MPWINRSNNRVLPANARAADVAEKAVQEIIPVQQRRYYSAFRVQGFECIAYNRLTTGRPCSCQSSQKQVQGLLDKDGKASPGTINKLLTGDLSFEVTPYSEGLDLQDGSNGPTSPFSTGNQYQGVFDVASTGPEFPFADVNTQTEDFGDNGPTNPVNIDDLLNQFDVGALGWSDVACPICFGSGFVGGFSAFTSHRHVLTATDVQPVQGYVDTLERPFVVRDSTGFSVQTVLPRGGISVEAFKVWNKMKIVPTVFSIDGQKINNDSQLLGFCDGRPHLVGAQFHSDFTHFEMQFGLSRESLYFEFPKRPSSADTSLLEQMEPFQIIMSPNIPYMESMDVIVESQLGKVLVVQNVNPWVSRQRNILGPECQVRVIQPQEIFRILPVKGRVAAKDQTTKMVRDNKDGAYRT